MKITVCNLVEKSWKGHEKTLLFYGLFVVLFFTASYVFALRSTRSDVALFTDWKSLAVGKTLTWTHQTAFTFIFCLQVINLLLMMGRWFVQIDNTTIKIPLIKSSIDELSYVVFVCSIVSNSNLWRFNLRLGLLITKIRLFCRISCMLTTFCLQCVAV